MDGYVKKKLTLSSFTWSGCSEVSRFVSSCWKRDRVGKGNVPDEAVLGSSYHCAYLVSQFELTMKSSRNLIMYLNRHVLSLISQSSDATCSIVKVFSSDAGSMRSGGNCQSNGSKRIWPIHMY